MSELHSTPATPAGKPAKPSKPSPDFPLFPHASGQWAKKIRGQMHYFGVWADPDAALALYLQQKDALHAGRKPREDTAGLTVKELANRFLNAKQALVDAGELSPRTWAEYKAAAVLVVESFGKGRLVADLDPDDFAALRNKMAKKWGPHRLAKMIQYTRSVFKHGSDAGLIDRPTRFGPGFNRPTKKTLRLHRAEPGEKLFTAEEIRRLIATAGLPMKSMLLLGVNCAFGNADWGHLPLTAVDLDAGIIDFPQPKTGIPRRCALWPETTAGLKEYLAKRPEPKDAADAGLVFITKYGQAWAKDTSENPVSREMGKLLRKLTINGRSGLGFYTLRNVFRMVADEARDQPATDFIMGYEVPHISSICRETISDKRLKAVADHVRNWLDGSDGVAGPDGLAANHSACRPADDSQHGRSCSDDRRSMDANATPCPRLNHLPLWRLLVALDARSARPAPVRLTVRVLARAVQERLHQVRDDRAARHTAGP